MSGEQCENPSPADLSRALLRGSRRASRDRPPLLRNQTSGHADEDQITLPAPVADVEGPTAVRILHVDDDPEILDVTKLFLERTDEDFTVVTETSVVEALNRLQNDSFDCIVSDYEMPNTDGLEFLEIVRETHPDIPFVLYTAKGSEAVASEAISAGVTEYMQKETSTEQYEVLANRIRNAVDRYYTQQRFWDALSWYRRIMEQNLAGVFIVQEGKFVYVNERLADMCEYLQSELLGESPEVIAASESDVAILDDLTGSASCRDGPFTREFTVETADGTTLAVEVHGDSILYEEESACIGIIWPTDPT